MELQDKKEDESSTLRRQKHEFYSELEGLEGLEGNKRGEAVVQIVAHEGCL